MCGYYATRILVIKLILSVTLLFHIERFKYSYQWNHVSRYGIQVHTNEIANNSLNKHSSPNSLLIKESDYTSGRRLD